MRLEELQGVGPIGSIELVLEGDVLQLQPVELRLQTPVLDIGIAQQNVVVEEARAAAAQAFQYLRCRRNCSYRPDADQRHAVSVLRVYRQQHELRHDDQQQHGDI